MRVKICGIKSLEAALHAVACGADAIGFVFAESSRKISFEKAKRIISNLPGYVWKVGVFVNEDAETIIKYGAEIGLTHVQLHGEEGPEYYKKMKLPIIKSIAITSREDFESRNTETAHYILLDSPPGKYRGGSGISFDWADYEDIENSESTIIVAGGLTPENVRQAIIRIKPFMVDVSSGVETEGEKDLDKIKEFISIAKEA